VRQALFTTLAANGMRDGVHVRLTLSRGLKTTSSMNPGTRLLRGSACACMHACAQHVHRPNLDPSTHSLLASHTVFNAYGCTLIILPEFKPVGGVATYVR
jgi:hypothetical protein